MAPNLQLAAFALDDFEVRSGSAASLLRTLSGLYLRHETRPIPRAKVIDLAVAAGLKATAAQTAATRLIDRGIFQTAPGGALQVSHEAQLMFARGDRRIFTPHQMADDDPWCLATYSIPESQRALRHQVRKHFLQLGGGMVAAGLWIFPGHLHAEVLAVLKALKAVEFTTLFTTRSPHFPHSPARSAAQWWDLNRLARRHREFLRSTEHLDPVWRTSIEAFAAYLHLVDAWRNLPYLDPGLPAQMLPEQWPGDASRARFESLSSAYQQASADFARAILGGYDHEAQSCP